MPITNRTSLDHLCISEEKEYDICAPYPCKIPGLYVSGGDSQENIGFLLQKKEE